jgi:hypothetical protein
MITLGGHPLLMPDSDGELLRWQEAFQNAQQYDLFAEPAALKSGRTGSRRESNTTAVGLPVANYPDPPPARINQLYWPTGATRWARGYFLANADSTTKIVTKSANYATAMDLKIVNSDIDSVVTIKVFLLPPRPITFATTSPATTNTTQLWLIPVVDERYFWNQDESGVLEPDNLPAWTWSDLYEYLITQAGASTDNYELNVSSSYEEPDKTEFTRRHDNIAVLIDAAVLSCGQRLVTRFDGKHYPHTTTTSNAVLTARNNAALKVVAGGQRTAFRAAKWIVAFNKFKHGRVLESGEKYFKEGEWSDTDTKSRSGSYYIVHTSMLADYSSGAHDNSTKCDTLALAIATDHEEWAKKQYDVTIAGVSSDILPCGHDDSITITFGAQRWNEEKSEYEYEAWTRIKSYPLNFGVECQLSQDPYIRVVSHFQDAIPAEDVTAGTSGNFYFYDAAGDLILDENDDPKTFEVHNEWGPDLAEDPLTGTGADYDRVRVHWQEETEKWEIVKVKNLPRRGKSDGAITGGSGTVQAYDESGTLITGYTVGVTSALGDVADDKWLIYDWINGHWEVVSAECD